MKIGSKSGRTFSQVGIEQKIEVGVLLRSRAYGSRIVVVLGKWESFWVMKHWANTAWLWHTEHQRWYTPKSRRRKWEVYHNPTEWAKPFLNNGSGWQVVREITK